MKKSINNLKLRAKLPKLIVTYEKARLETGGGVKNAIHNFKKSKLLIINGDSFLHYLDKDCPIINLHKNYDELKMDVLLLLSRNIKTFGYNGSGDYKKLNYSNASKISKENIDFNQRHIFTGWQIINRKIFNNFSEGYFSLKKVYDMAEENGRLYGILHNGLFFHVGDPKSYMLTIKYFNSGKI